MTFLSSLFPFIIIILVLIGLVKLFSGKSKPKYKYESRQYLMSPAERSFLGVLDSLIEDDYRIFSKVRVADILNPLGDSKTRFAGFNKINRKHFDFVLCEPATMEIVCVIELNDKSHRRKSRSDRDDFIASACESAGVPFLTVAAQKA